MKLISVLTLSALLVAGSTSAALAQMQPGADSSAPANPAMKGPNDPSNMSLAKGHNSFTKGQAKGRIEKAGYTGVSGLMLDGDGLWQAQAMKDGQSVKVALDYKGTVAAQ